MLKAVFFDAAGTLIYLPRSVGEHYQEIAAAFGAKLDADALNKAFKAAWKAAPLRVNTTGARPADDKGWWRELVQHVLRLTLSAEEAHSFDVEGYFEAVYAHFALPDVWRTFDDVQAALLDCRSRGLLLGLISNFDRRLYAILDGLKLRECFDTIVLSSEVGSDKPDPFIFQTALSSLRIEATEAIHVGDEPTKDGGAAATGMQVFHLQRPARSLYHLAQTLDQEAGR